MKTPPAQRAAGRRKLAAKGQALPAADGQAPSFPIPDVAYLKKAIRSVGRAPAARRPALKALIRKRAKELGALDAPGVKGTWPFTSAKAMAGGGQLALDFAAAGSVPAVSSMDGPRVTMMDGGKPVHPAAKAIYRKLRSKGLKHGQALALTKKAMARHAAASAKAAWVP